MGRRRLIRGEADQRVRYYFAFLVIGASRSVRMQLLSGHSGDRMLAVWVWRPSDACWVCLCVCVALRAPSSPVASQPCMGLLQPLLSFCRL